MRTCILYFDPIFIARKHIHTHTSTDTDLAPKKNITLKNLSDVYWREISIKRAFALLKLRRIDISWVSLFQRSHHEIMNFWFDIRSRVRFITTWNFRAFQRRRRSSRQVENDARCRTYLRSRVRFVHDYLNNLATFAIYIFAIYL